MLPCMWGVASVAAAVAQQRQHTTRVTQIYFNIVNTFYMFLAAGVHQFADYAAAAAESLTTRQNNKLARSQQQQTGCADNFKYILKLLQRASTQTQWLLFYFLLKMNRNRLCYVRCCTL